MRSSPFIGTISIGHTDITTIQSIIASKIIKSFFFDRGEENVTSPSLLTGIFIQRFNGEGHSLILYPNLSKELNKLSVQFS